jgi:hypothetical protein
MLRASIVLVAFATTLAAADGPKVEMLTFGKTVVGPTYKKEELKGKLLLVEEWGLH